MSNALNPCPICAGKAVLVIGWDWSHDFDEDLLPGQFGVQCQYGCQSLVTGETRSQVTEKWNMRGIQRYDRETRGVQ